MAAVVASSMSKASVALPSIEQAHADPRFHMERSAADDTVEATLLEEEELRLKRELAADAEWVATRGDGVDPDDLGWSEED